MSHNIFRIALGQPRKAGAVSYINSFDGIPGTGYALRNHTRLSGWRAALGHSLPLLSFWYLRAASNWVWGIWFLIRREFITFDTYSVSINGCGLIHGSRLLFESCIPLPVHRKRNVWTIAHWTVLSLAWRRRGIVQSYSLGLKLLKVLNYAVCLLYSGMVSHCDTLPVFYKAFPVKCFRISSFWLLVIVRVHRGLDSSCLF